MQIRFSLVAATFILSGIIAAGCKDLGENPPPPPIPPRIEGVSADTVGPGEVLEILGSGFDTFTPMSAVIFADNRPATIYPEWTDTRIRVVVPDSAVSGPVKVRKGTTESNVRSIVVALIVPPDSALTFSQPGITLTPGQSGSVQISGGTSPYAIQSAPDGAVAAASLAGDVITITGVGAGTTFVTVVDVSTPPKTATLNIRINPPPAGVSFSREIIPIFSANCTSCHGGTAGLFLTPGEAYTNLVNVPAQTGTCAGTPRVTPGNSSASALYLRVTGNCSQRMPLGGQLAASDIELIRQWIDQGAENN